MTKDQQLVITILDNAVLEARRTIRALLPEAFFFLPFLVGHGAGISRASVQANDHTSGTNITLMASITYEATA